MVRFERRVILRDDLSRNGATVREKVSKQKLKSLRKKPRTTSIIFIPVHDFFQMTQLKAVKIEQREREKGGLLTKQWSRISSRKGHPSERVEYRRWKRNGRRRRQNNKKLVAEKKWRKKDKVKWHRCRRAAQFVYSLLSKHFVTAACYTSNRVKGISRIPRPKST